MSPGSVSATRTPKRLNSTDRASVSPFTACFVAEYVAIPAIPNVADDDEVVKQSEFGVALSKPRGEMDAVQYAYQVDVDDGHDVVERLLVEETEFTNPGIVEQQVETTVARR